MASARIGRINDDIQRILADRLRQVKDPRVSDQGMITITRVDTTGDLRYAKVWLSVYGLKDEKEFKKGPCFLQEACMLRVLRDSLMEMLPLRQATNGNRLSSFL